MQINNRIAAYDILQKLFIHFQDVDEKIAICYKSKT